MLSCSFAIVSLHSMRPLMFGEGYVGERCSEQKINHNNKLVARLANHAHVHHGFMCDNWDRMVNRGRYPGMNLAVTVCNNFLNEWLSSDPLSNAIIVNFSNFSDALRELYSGSYQVLADIIEGLNENQRRIIESKLAEFEDASKNKELVARLANHVHVHHCFTPYNWEDMVRRGIYHGDHLFAEVCDSFLDEWLASDPITEEQMKEYSDSYAPLEILIDVLSDNQRALIENKLAEFKS